MSRAGRGQSHVVGVVLLLALTAVAMGALVASVGAIVDDHTSHADASRVASDFETALRPVETTGPRTGTVSLLDGRLSTEPRQLRILRGGTVTRTVAVDALIYESGGRRVTYLAGAVLRGRGEGAYRTSDPPITSGPHVLVVGAPALNGSASVSVNRGGTIPLRTNVTHHRSALGTATFGVAIETESPAAFGGLAPETRVNDLDGDGIPSVLLDYPGSRKAYLVVHDMRLEVGRG